MAADRHGIGVGVAGWDSPNWLGVVYPANAGRAFDGMTRSNSPRC